MEKDENQTDPKRDFQEEKLKMSSGKASMTKKIKKLENAITDFKELNLMNLPNKDMQGAVYYLTEKPDRSLTLRSENMVSSYSYMGLRRWRARQNDGI